MQTTRTYRMENVGHCGKCTGTVSRLHKYSHINFNCSSMYATSSMDDPLVNLVGMSSFKTHKTLHL